MFNLSLVAPFLRPAVSSARRSWRSYRVAHAPWSERGQYRLELENLLTIEGVANRTVIQRLRHALVSGFPCLPLGR